MAYNDCTCPTLARNSHLQAQVDSQEFRGKGVQNVGKGGGAGGMVKERWETGVVLLGAHV